MVIEGLDNNTQEAKRNSAKVHRELREALAPMEGALKDYGPRISNNDQHLSQHDQQLREHDQRLSALESAAA
ncbi:MAG: hypothetical protein GY856_11630 [bacterium]|nr:hypothetical protein [bacterium]